MFFAGHKLINPPASKLASDYGAFDPGIIQIDFRRFCHEYKRSKGTN